MAPSRRTGPRAATALELVVDELAIRKLLARLAQAADDRDAAGYRACLTDSVRAAPSKCTSASGRRLVLVNPTTEEPSGVLSPASRGSG